MLRKKRERCGAPAKVTAILLVLMMLIALIAVGVVPVAVDAASAALGGSETINIYLQDSSWQVSQVRVNQLGSDASVKKSETLTPADNKLNITGVSGTTEIVLEQFNSTKSANLTSMRSIIGSASSTQAVVFYDNTSAQWTDLKYYAWSKVNGVTIKDADWDHRKSLIRLGTTNIWYAVINRNASLSSAYENIIFTGSGSQTDDLTLKASTAENVQIYSSTTNNWTQYTDVDKSVKADVKDRFSDSHNNLYVVSKTVAKWSKYNSSSPTATVYFKPNAAWDNAYIHYDDDVDEPFYTTVKMTVENESPLIFKATVYAGAMVSFSNGPDFDESDKKDQGSVFSDTDEPCYVSAARSWTTLDNAKTNDVYPSDLIVKDTNFNDVTPTGGGKVVGFDAYYYDYLSDNERLSDWRKYLNDDSFDGAGGPDGSYYRTQFSQLNDDIKNLALSNTDWRYPLFFGDDWNTNSYITNYYNALASTRNPSITQANFNAVNNSNYLNGDNSRSVMGLVKPTLKNGYLMITDTKRSPYFDDEFLQAKGTSVNKEVLYILDDNNYGRDGIYCNFWNDSKSFKDQHPTQVTDNAVTIDGKTGILYRYVVDADMKGAQLSHTKDYSQHFWKYDPNPNGEWYVYKYTDIVTTSGGSVSSGTYQSGVQNLSNTVNRAKIINSKFPFVETTDPTTKVKTYVFDSNGSSRKDNISFGLGDVNKVYYYNDNGYQGKLDGNNGFFPFNGAYHETRNYGFGVRVDVDFTIPMNGMLTATKPAEFTFTGDDDVWVFIDGQLILDIGGAHTPTEGTINFGAGVNQIKATTKKVYGIMSTTSSSDTSVNGSKEVPFNFNNTDPTKKHRMTVFYMERGTNDSNLRIEFSIQPILNELNVYKEVEVEGVNHGLSNTVKTLAENSDFDFTFLQNSSGYGGTSGKTYNIVHADDTTTTGTIENGVFKLKNYEEAMFHNDTDLAYGDTMKVSEAATSYFDTGTARRQSPFVYDTEIVVKDNLYGDVITPTQQNEKDVSFTFKNTRNLSEERTSLVAEFTNTMKVADLKIQKNLYEKGSTTASSHDTPFKFTLGLDLDNDETYEFYDFDYYYEGHADEVFTAHDGVFQMRPSQKVIIEGIPVGTPYILTETQKAGYRIKDGSYIKTGTVPDAELTELIFNNEESPSAQNIDVYKKLDNALYSGNEFTFNCALVKWIKSDGVTTVTDATTLSKTYAANSVSVVRDGDELGVIGFDPFNIVPDDESSGTYILEISETDKSDTQPLYIYDHQKYYAKIIVQNGTVAAPVFYKDLACTQAVSNVTFMNSTAKGSITVNKTDVDQNPLAGAQFAVIKVSSEADVDALLTPENINALVEANRTDPEKVRLETTVMSTVSGNSVASAVFDNLDLYQTGGMFVAEGGAVVWSDSVVTDSDEQVYCVFEYTPAEGFLPNYTKTYVTLAEQTNASFTFGLVDAQVVMPNSSGGGSAFYQWLGLGIIAFAALLFGAYMLMRKRKKPVHAARFIQ